MASTEPQITDFDPHTVLSMMHCNENGESLDQTDEFPLKDLPGMVAIFLQRVKDRADEPYPPSNEDGLFDDIEPLKYSDDSYMVIMVKDFNDPDRPMNKDE